MQTTKYVHFKWSSMYDPYQSKVPQQNEREKNRLWSTPSKKKKKTTNVKAINIPRICLAYNLTNQHCYKMKGNE